MSLYPVTLNQLSFQKMHCIKLYVCECVKEDFIVRPLSDYSEDVLYRIQIIILTYL